jgi:glycosyltransferase involved in cell wall biosynthesis
LLYVGGLSPHKNLPRLVEAFARASGDDVRLVLTGDVHDVFHTCVPAIRATIDGHGLGDRVLLTGFVPDEDLVFLYGRAYALMQPSLLEGFGLPAVEAMACGTPVIASWAGSLPEVIGGAGAFFDPTDVDSIAAAIRELLADPDRRDQLAIRALRRSARFTWDAAARGLLDCFDELDPAGPAHGPGTPAPHLGADRCPEAFSGITSVEKTGRSEGPGRREPPRFGVSSP